jgi:hypothetical protein
MGVLATIEKVLELIPLELIENSVLYVELDQKSYDGVDSETQYVQQSKVPDIGLSKVFSGPNGHKIICVLNKEAKSSESCYVAFRTKLI